MEFTTQYARAPLRCLPDEPDASIKIILLDLHQLWPIQFGMRVSLHPSPMAGL